MWMSAEILFSLLQDSWILKISSNASWLLLSVNVILELMGCQHVPKPLISRASVFHPGILN